MSAATTFWVVEVNVECARLVEPNGRGGSESNSFQLIWTLPAAVCRSHRRWNKTKSTPIEIKQGLSTNGILLMSFEIERTRDEQSTLCSRGTEKYEKKTRNFMMKVSKHLTDCLFLTLFLLYIQCVVIPFQGKFRTSYNARSIIRKLSCTYTYTRQFGWCMDVVTSYHVPTRFATLHSRLSAGVALVTLQWKYGIRYFLHYLCI
jgi:hypothetical protein